MASELQNENALRSVWEELGILETELAADRGGTIVQGAKSVEPTMSWSAVVGRLPRIEAEGGELIVLGDEIGRGGMGVVRSGRQRSLDREVAVKTTLDEMSASATQSLLREAWISGQLEHPNVIPIHALYRGDEAPLLVMKRVEGQAWSQALREGGSVEGHLRTLAQVCHAVHFAHTRGFVHLDLKPDNIMIGGYGEIYLLDWGIAACIRDDIPDFIPRAGKVRGVLGTPAYMAPELASAEGKIDARTDVYLLGAVLHEILTKRPPHAAETLMGSLASAFASDPPQWPADVPRELAAIAGRALARDPDERFSTAAELREALEDYLVHADSLSLAAAARERADQVIETLEPDDSEGDVDRLASQAEFGFRQALHVWPGNDAARESLQELLEALIERDLAAERWQVAARRLTELPFPREELEERVLALERASSEEGDELRRLRADVDLGKAAAQRGFLAYGGALIWVVLLLGLGTANRLGQIDPRNWHMFTITAVGMVFVYGYVFHAREALLANAANRKTVGILAVGWAFGVLYWAAMWRTGATFETAVVGVSPLSAFGVGAIAFAVDRSMLPATAVAALGVVAVIALPPWSIELLGVTGGIVLVMLGKVWKGAVRDDAEGERHS